MTGEPTGSDRTRFALTRAQANVWLAEQQSGDAGRFTIGEVVEIDGAIDPARFEDALRATLRETEVGLVHIVEERGEVHQELDLDLAWSLRVLELGDGDDPATVVGAASAEVMARGFALDGAGPLFEHILFRDGERRAWWFWAGHHIVADAVSGAMVLLRVAERYSAAGTTAAAGTTGGVDPIEAGALARLVEGDQAYVGSAAAGRDAQWWVDRMAGAAEPVRLSRTDRPPSGTTVRSIRPVGAELDRRIRAACSTAGRRPSALVTAAVAAYLHRITGVDDLVLGLPVTARSGPALRAQPGMLANVVPLRVAVRPESTPDELVDAVGRELQKVALRQRHRGEDLSRALRVPGGVLGLIGPSVNFMAFDHALSFAGAPGWRARCGPDRWTTSPSPSTTAATARAWCSTWRPTRPATRRPRSRPMSIGSCGCWTRSPTT